MAIDYSERIPNNVDLAQSRSLQRALEQWQPKFLDWWKELGPADFQASDVYLRTAISVDSKGWANYGHVRMPDYRWGIFLADPEVNRTIGFGDDYGKPVWQQVPGEHRSTLRRRRSNSSARSVIPRRRSMTCVISFKSTSRKVVISGRWCTCCKPISAATGVKKLKRC